jgi:hypothetical protein
MNKKLPDSFGKERLYNEYFEEQQDKVILWEVLPIQNNGRIKVRFLSVNSDNRQGIRLAIDAGKGSLTINGESAKQFDLWEDTCPKEFEVKCESDEGYLSVYNIFEELDWTGKKRRNSQMPYSGMILEQSGNTYRYSCNNAKLNSEFDKLVFEIELLDD